MTILDLTHVIEPGMPVFPGTERPVFEIPLTIAANGFQEHRLTLYSHTGTHMDAPAHLIPGAACLDGLAAETFVGPACVVDVRGFAGRAVPAAFLEPHLEALRAADFLLLRSGWDARWGAPDYFSGFPHLAVEAARLAVSCGLKGVGVDAISIDAHDSTAFEVHHVLLGAGVVVLENLARLDQLPATGATLVAAPLKFRGSDGAPIRALALVG